MEFNRPESTYATELIFLMPVPANKMELFRTQYYAYTRGLIRFSNCARLFRLVHLYTHRNSYERIIQLNSCDNTYYFGTYRIVSNKGSGEPAHMRRLDSAFVVRIIKVWM